MGVPQNHPFSRIFPYNSLINHPFWEPPFSGNHHMVMMIMVRTVREIIRVRTVRTAIATVK